MARFVVEGGDGLDVSVMHKSYRGSGSASCHPSLLLGVLVYGYATGVFSSRKPEQATYDSVAFRFAVAPPAPDNPDPLDAMAYRLHTPKGQKLYGQRKQTPEPVFGIIKSVMGLRQFLLRGRDNVQGKWRLVTLAWNMKRIFALSVPT